MIQHRTTSFRLRPPGLRKGSRAEARSPRGRRTGIVLAGSLVLALVLGVGGYFVGSFASAASLSRQNAALGAVAYAQQDATDEALNQSIEKINVQEQVVEQDQQIAALQQQVSNAKQNILNALMRNLTTRLSTSRGITGYKSYIAQAKVLVSLNGKIRTFSTTADAKTIDISSYKAEVASRLSHIPTLHPIPGTYTGYGWRIHPIFKIRQFHPADDIGAPTGTSIKAAGAGIVVLAEYDWSAGNYIIIDHGNGFRTVYMHCSVLKVSVGQHVSKGQVIGKVGMTGTATAPHLHFEVQYNGVPFNPTEILMEW